MIVQTQAAILTQLMATDYRHNSRDFIDAIQDALIMAREAAHMSPLKTAVSNDRTFLKHKKRL